MSRAGDQQPPEIVRRLSRRRPLPGFYSGNVAAVLARGYQAVRSQNWAVLMVPAALLVAFGFASFGMGITSFMRTFQQMDLINFILLPMFLFSATLYPVTVYPRAVQYVVEAMPLWHGVETMRQLSVGYITWATGGHALYFLAMTALGMWLTTTRLRALFLR